jgi:hypothetical protein
MDIKTEYEVGHKFWVPRSLISHEVEELKFEGETWRRNVPVYNPSAKQKEIIGINVRVDMKGISTITYSVVTAGEYNTLSQHYGEDIITSYTEEEALDIAKRYAEDKQEYHGN